MLCPISHYRFSVFQSLCLIYCTAIQSYISLSPSYLSHFPLNTLLLCLSLSVPHQLYVHLCRISHYLCLTSHSLTLCVPHSLSLPSSSLFLPFHTLSLPYLSISLLVFPSFTLFFTYLSLSLPYIHYVFHYYRTLFPISVRLGLIFHSE